MKEKPLLYFLAKMAAVIAAISVLNSAAVDITVTVISTLSFACVFILEILLDRLRKNKQVIVLTLVAAAAACFALGMESYFPVFILSLTHLMDLLIDSKMFYYILGTVFLLSVMIFLPGSVTVIFTLTVIILLLFGRFIIGKLDIYNEMNERQKAAIIELNKKLADVKSLTKTLKYTVSIEERNRIAARIHDQLGHGISGSIIMLEASMMIMKDNPDKAVTSIEKAIINLREGVDEIRASLRDERAGHYLIGMNEITAMLEEFKFTYNKSALFKTSGDMNAISLEVWACIHDNVKECLTNVLKHSNASEFTLNIEVFKKIIKVEYRDNGTSAESFEKGMGLEAMEERTIGARGRCFFNKGEKGFCVTNIFTY
jgi:signal transduction histidine kinase